MHNGETDIIFSLNHSLLMDKLNIKKIDSGKLYEIFNENQELLFRIREDNNVDQLYVHTIKPSDEKHPCADIINLFKDQQIRNACKKSISDLGLLKDITYLDFRQNMTLKLNSFNIINNGIIKNVLLDDNVIENIKTQILDHPEFMKLLYETATGNTLTPTQQIIHEKLMKQIPPGYKLSELISQLLGDSSASASDGAGAGTR